MFTFHQSICLHSQIPRTSVQRHTQVDGKAVVIEEKLSTEGNRYRTVLSSVYAGGDYGRLMEGVFENYLDIKFKDMHLENVSVFCPQSSLCD